jgi:EF hand domain-containing protein
MSGVRNAYLIKFGVGTEEIPRSISESLGIAVPEEHVAGPNDARALPERTQRPHVDKHGGRALRPLHSKWRRDMKSLLTTATLAIGLALPAVAQVDPGRSSPLAAGMGGKQAQAQTQDCTGMWKRADVNHKGVLDGKELDKFRSVLNTVDTNKDGKISQSEFMTACQKGELKNIQL